MKKLLAVVLAAMMVLSLGVMASAIQREDNAVIKVDAQWYDGNTDKPIGDLHHLNWVNIDQVDPTNDLVQPDSTVWIALGGNSGVFTDKDLFKVKTDKGDDNAKLISKVSVATSTSDKYKTAGRQDSIKIEVKPVYDDGDYKFTPSVKFTAKEDKTVVPTFYNVPEVKDGAGNVVRAKDTVNEGDYLQVDISFYMANVVQGADQDYNAGDGGVVLKPAKNDDNEITWEDENNTIATLKFAGDDNQTKFFPKLSTKWEDADYAEYFADQDAFIFNFVASGAGQTKISSTSRATLELYNPYYDCDEDELTVEPENCVVYMVGDDGSINDVTASFKAVETDDGDYVFQTKTRELGIYIIAEKPYTTAAAEDVETPDDGKAIPDTGIWA